ncbi:uncharacterized protein LOC112512961 [Cynara cardunculus var. scolymus]|uniref:uncharacterized protein LOC112512961 n=1 Tax=Cynara cardunculus var. scolymus TaxID=59895 RepID=UPI000D6277A9|nr:uncharacterized protein LOC112512961 [Cynara cardunculus var. scolymus]
MVKVNSRLFMKDTVLTASSSSSSTSVRHVRSISLPSQSHPSTLQVEEELTYLKTWEASSSSMATVDTVCGSLVVLERLYTSVNNLLSLPLTQQALFTKDEKLVDELLDRSMKLLDVCGSIKDTMEQVKEHVKNVQSALRRKKSNLSMDASLLRKLMKDANRAISALKKSDNKTGDDIALLDLDHHLSTVIRSLRNAGEVSISIFGSVLSLKSIFVSKPKSTKWSVVSNLIWKGNTMSIDQPQISNEALESHIEVIQSSLECVFRTLMKTRVCLLNIRSH